MEVITVAYEPANENFKEIFVPSCESCNLELIVLEYHYDLPTNRIKDILLFEYLKSVSNNTIILYAEAGNTIFLADQKEILRKFKAFRCEILFSSFCKPKRNSNDSDDTVSYSNNTIDPSGFIGYAGSLKSIYQKYPFFPVHLQDGVKSNQCYWHDIYLQEFPVIKLDVKQELFFRLPAEYAHIWKQVSIATYNGDVLSVITQDSLSVNFKNGRIQHTSNDIWPCIANF